MASRGGRDFHGQAQAGFEQTISSDKIRVSFNMFTV